METDASDVNHTLASICPHKTQRLSLCQEDLSRENWKEWKFQLQVNASQNPSKVFQSTVYKWLYTWHKSTRLSHSAHCFLSICEAIIPCLHTLFELQKPRQDPDGSLQHRFCFKNETEVVNCVKVKHFLALKLHCVQRTWEHCYI